ncbi:hypothetical protein P9314_08240 [Paenibacillus validus]|uniref:hypothetical protein n=1 Tax=Paenibacillus TaxID=44249 RepID=UPI000FDBB33F|nr:MULTISPECIES: hypothetical protein [Paenibacillus]MED4600691.1 hypothetical protein [Paenibacillus validus]MED4605330.1 hypothetical protein [Paenibacillus validus]
MRPIDNSSYSGSTSLYDLNKVGLGIQQQIFILKEGSCATVYNSSNNMSGNTFNGDINGNIGQGGRDVVQTSNVTSGVTEETLVKSQALMADLVKFIDGLPEAQEKKDAQNDVTQLQEAIKNKNFDRAKKTWGMFGDVVRTSSSGLAIAKLFGWL